MLSNRFVFKNLNARKNAAFWQKIHFYKLIPIFLGTTAECVKDATSGTTGLLYATCSSTGFVLTINEQCRSNDYSGISATLFYVGSNSANCKFSTIVSSNYVLDDTTLAFPSACDITSVDDGTYTTYTASVNFDNTGLDYGISTGTVACKIENSNTANAVVTQITGWAFEFPDYSSTIDAWDGTGMPTVVTMNHNIPGSNTVNLGDIVQISINDLSSGVFTYRKWCRKLVLG